VKLLFLRGKVPTFKPERLKYDHIWQCEDMWTILAERMCKYFNEVELWYWGGDYKKIKVVSPRFVERWVPDLNKLPVTDFDVVIARGGFSDCLKARQTIQSAKWVYYGAGNRFKPSDGNWDIILVDSVKQQKQVPGSKLFIKPAAENIFYPHPSFRFGKKNYDVCFMANSTDKDIKRIKLTFETFKDSRYSLLHIGMLNDRDKQLAKKHNIKSVGWQRRANLSAFMSQCKMGLICSTEYDSCPRVLPEFLVCGLPVIVTNDMNIWFEKYITPETGISCQLNTLGILNGIYHILKHYDQYNSYNYYWKNLSINHAAKHLWDIIK